MVLVLLGNDKAGGRVQANPKVTTHPRVVNVPDELEQKFPKILFLFVLLLVT